MIDELDKRFCAYRYIGLPSRRGQVRTTSMRHLSRHADALAQRGVRVNRLANVYCICTHFDGQGNLAAPANWQ